MSEKLLELEEKGILPKRQKPEETLDAGAAKPPVVG
jgi:hypothetical protein